MAMGTAFFPKGFFPGGFWPDGFWPKPPVYPVSLDEMKVHLRVVTDDDDRLIAQLILAATSWAELFQHRLFIERPAYMYLDEFPAVIRAGWSPLVSVGSIKYIDENGILQLLADSDYRIDIRTEPGRIEPAWTLDWPATRNITNAVIIEYSAGYGAAADVPDDIKSAIKLLVGHWYENRNAVEEDVLDQVPEAAINLLWRRRLIMS